MISPLWSKFAKHYLGNAEGRHCHWCKYILTEDGYATCNNPDSKFFDDDRIRTWDGIACAKDCRFFELDDWYTDDRTFNRNRDVTETP